MERIVEPTELQIEFARKIPSLILASSSSNRKALLEKGGVKIMTYSPNTKEERDNLTPIEAIKKIVKEKFEAYKASSAFNPNMVAISADTLILKDNVLLGKPKDIEDARSMLRLLSGSEQRVLTAVALYIPQKCEDILIDSAKVIFKKLSNDDIESYLAKDEWQGAAGGYRLQRSGYTLIDTIDGDWTTVVGLPLKAILKHFN